MIAICLTVVETVPHVGRAKLVWVDDRILARSKSNVLFDLVALHSEFREVADIDPDNGGRVCMARHKLHYNSVHILETELNTCFCMIDVDKFLYNDADIFPGVYIVKNNIVDTRKFHTLVKSRI